MQDTLNPVWVFIAAFGLSAFAGLAALLRAEKTMSRPAIASAMLNSGLFGAAVAMIWYRQYQDNIYFLIGMCLLGGLGGATLVEFVISAIKSFIATRVGAAVQSLEREKEKEIPK